MHSLFLNFWTIFEQYQEFLNNFWAIPVVSTKPWQYSNFSQLPNVNDSVDRVSDQDHNNVWRCSNATEISISSMLYIRSHTGISSHIDWIQSLGNEYKQWSQLGNIYLLVPLLRSHEYLNSNICQYMSQHHYQPNVLQRNKNKSIISNSWPELTSLFKENWLVKQKVKIISCNTPVFSCYTLQVEHIYKSKVSKKSTQITY